MLLCVLSYYRSESRTGLMWWRQGRALNTLQASQLTNHDGWDWELSMIFRIYGSIQTHLIFWHYSLNLPVQTLVQNKESLVHVLWMQLSFMLLVSLFSFSCKSDSVLWEGSLCEVTKRHELTLIMKLWVVTTQQMQWDKQKCQEDVSHRPSLHTAWEDV